MCCGYYMHNSLNESDLLRKSFNVLVMCAFATIDTIVVIIVSVSLALLVCAIIPLIIFYGHWRSTTGNVTYA